MTTAQNLLRQYSKNDPNTLRNPINIEADDNDDVKKLVTRSYLNTYDALYNKYSATQNFNIDMLQNAIKLGEQDAYFALLEQNKNNTLSPQFYDPQYYDYETMMLELYKNVADNTDKTLETRYKDVFNTTTGKWEQQSIGDMTERQYLQYQLDEAYSVKKEQFIKEQELMHKENMGWWKKSWANVGATAGELGEGIVSAMAGFVDFFVAPAYATGKTMFGSDRWYEWDDAYVNYFGEKGLTAAEKEGLRASLDDFERKYTSFKDIDGNTTNIGKYLGGMANSIGMMIPSILLAIPTGGTSLAWTAQASFYTSIFSSNLYENAVNPELKGSPAWMKVLNAGVKSGVEWIIEWGLSKALGGTIQNNLLNIGGKLNVAAIRGGAKGLTRGAVKYFFKSAGQEALEEVMQDFSTFLVDEAFAMFNEGYAQKGFSAQTLIDSAILGFTTSLVLGGMSSYVTSPIMSAATGRGNYSIEVDGEVQKLRGLTRTYYASLVNEFSEAVNKLKNNKFGIDKNIELAQEVYAALGVFSQFYSTIGEERMQLASYLLDRVANAQNAAYEDDWTEEQYKKATEDEVLKHKTDLETRRSDKNRGKAYTQLRAQNFGAIVETIFTSAMVDANERAKTKVKEATEKVSEELKKNGVTDVKTITDNDGNTYAKNPTIADIEKDLGSAAKEKVDKMKDDYDYLITVDGHTAVEEDGILFVSESWLENYSEHEIYKFLEQQRVIKELSTDKEHAEFNKDLVAFAKEFTGKEIELEEAIMNFLTNENFHQAFILSHKGATLDKYRKFIVGYAAITNNIATRKISADKRLSEKTKETRANYAKQYFEQMKKIARKGIFAACLNWNFTPQDLNAGIMLEKADVSLINQRRAEKKRKAEAFKEGHKSSYRRDVDELIELGKESFSPLSTKDIELIRHYQRGTGTNDEQLMGLVILNLLDNANADVDSSVLIFTRAHLDYLNGHLQLPTPFLPKEDLLIEHNILLDRLRFYTIQPENIPQTLLSAHRDFQAAAETLFENTGEEIGKRDGYLLAYRSSLVNLFNELVDFGEAVGVDIAPVGSKIISLPVQAFSGMPEGAHEIQYKADKIAEFEKMYGVSPSKLYSLTGIQMPNGDYMIPQMIRTTQLFKDAFVVSKLSPRDFVTQEMEKLLGKDYMVVPNYFPTNLVGATAKTAMPKYDFSIIKKIPAEELLVSDIEQKLVQRTPYDFLRSLSRADILKIEQEMGYGFVRDLFDVDADRFDFALKFLNTHTGKFVNPLTGEPRHYLDAPTLFNVLKQIKDNSIHLSELLSIDIPRFKDWTVIIDPEASDPGFVNVWDKKITIRYSDEIDTLVHEINHAIHSEYGLTYGANPEALKNSEKLLRNVCEHYGPLVHFGARYLRGHEDYELDGIDWNDFDSIVKRLGTDIYGLIAILAYEMNMGEILAREYAHSKKPVRGYTTVNYNGKEFIVSPHNEKFPTVYTALEPLHYELIPRNNNQQKSKPIVISKKVDTPAPINYQLTANTVGNAFVTVMRGRKINEQGRDTEVYRDTYHSAFTGDVTQIVESLVRNDLPFLLKFNLSIDKILSDPEYYLKDEILASMPDDKKNAAFFAVKAYLEKNFGNISLDLDARTHEYILVNDNAFDDLFNNRASVANQKPGENTFAEAYTEKTVTLGEFYDKRKLKEFGLSPDIPVIIGANQESKFVVTAEYPDGVVCLNMNGTESNAAFFDALNHEFRHVMQYYHGLDLGFTPDFDVSDAMLADVKAHVPEIFKLEDLRELMKNQLIKAHRPTTEKDIDKFIVQNFVYFLVSGELNAYGIRAELLFGKPIYVTYEAGKATIFMPWYDAKTGEGRWKTAMIVSRAVKDDSAEVKKTSGPKVKKIELNTQIKQRQIVRYLAKGTNLERYVKTGVETELDQAMQEFVIATTGHENELPIELMSLIYEGKLNRQLFNQWFKEVNLSEVNDFTFQLINKYLFNNPIIKSAAELEQFIDLDIRYYWAIPLVLSENNLSIESFLAEKDVNDIVSLLKRIMTDPELARTIEKKAAEFTTFGRDKEGNPISFDLDPEDIGWARLLAMQYFNGTPANVFYIAQKFRNKMVQSKHKGEGKISIEDSVDDQKGGKSRTAGEEISEADIFDESGEGYDIWLLAERSQTKTLDEMKAELYWLKENKLINTVTREMSGKKKEKAVRELTHFDEYKKEIDIARKGGTLTAADEKHYLAIERVRNKIDEKMQSFQTKLLELDEEEVLRRYNEAMGSVLMNRTITEKTLDLSSEGYKTNRRAVQKAIEQDSNVLLRLLNNKRISINSLSPEVRDYFFVETTKNEDGSSSTKYAFRKDVASVRSAPLRKTVSGERSRSHDTAQIVYVSSNLRHERARINKALREEKVLAEKIEKAAKKSRETLERKAAKVESQKINVKDEGLTKTEFTVKPKKKKSASDTPNYFSVYSTIDMPEVLKKLFDVSFDELVNTEVQFMTIDVNTGKLYDKKEYEESGEKFESDLKHEAVGFEAFYEAVRSQLSELNRQDALDIIEFFEKGAFTVDGPINKLIAFEIFILAYIYDAARKGTLHFSDAELDHLRKLFAYKASGHGTGLQAVNQVLEMLDPFHRTRSQMLEDYGIGEEYTDPFFKTLQELQKEKDPKRITDRAKVVAQQLNLIEKEMLAFKLKEAKEMKWSKRWYRNMKSFRFTSMLSSPATWARNYVSNWTLTGLNNASDIVAKMVFALPKKAYREDQWDLTGVVVSQEAKAFIEKYILNNPVFDPLYYSTGKFSASEKRKLRSQKTLFVNLIVKALEDHYESTHRYYGASDVGQKIADKANFVASWVDKMISDEKFVKRAATKYFGKILTIESQKKNGIDLSKGLSDEALQLFAESVIAANQDYMHKRSYVIEAIDKIRERNPLAYEILTIWQPFINSSWNWFEESLKLTPIGLIGAITRFAKLEKQIEEIEKRRSRGEMIPSNRMTEYLIRRDIGKGIVGTIGLVLGVLLLMSGCIRLEEDDEKFYVVAGKDGNVKVDISNIFGSSSLLIGASLAQTWVEGDPGNIDNMFGYVTNELFNGFVVNDLLERHKYDQGIYEFFLTETESVFKSFVPQIVQLAIRHTNNEKIKYSAGMKGMWERWLNSFVPTQPMGTRRINPYTGEVETKYAQPFFGNLLNSGILGPKIFWSEIDETERMCREFGVNKGQLDGEISIKGKKVKVGDALTLNEKYGKLNSTSLIEIQSQKHYVEMEDGSFKTLPWEKLSDKQKGRVIEKTMTHNAQIAKIAMWTEAGHKYYASDSLFATLRQLGITQNVYRGDKGFVE